MSDPRNVAHDKKVKQEKSHQPSSVAGTKKRRGLKTERGASAQAEAPAAAPAVEAAPEDFEKSQTVLSKLKEMEFHSRANIETLAQLTLTIEDELKQKEFSGAIGDTYAAQNAFQSKIAELIQSYETKMAMLQPTP